MTNNILKGATRVFKGKKLILPFWILLIVSILTGAATESAFPGLTGPGGKGIRTVVIDAGHGGKDPGALGKHSKEKDIVLSVALKTGKLIASQYSEVKVIYTRSKDEFIELYKRAEIANRNQADLFISIHCNASKSKVHYGAETFVMGLHKSEANLSVAKLENAAVLFEEDYTVQYEGFDPNSPESHILFSFYQNIYREQSLDFASRIQQELTHHSSRFDRGVKEAGFLVLYRTSMPSVLVELGFISHPEEEQYLRSQKGQDQLAMSLFKAFSAYKESLEGNLPGLPPAAKTNEPVQTADTGKKPETASPAQTETKPEPKTIQGVVYRVQFLTSGVKLPVNHSKLKNLTEVFEYQHQGSFKYTSGKFETEQEANQYRDKLRKEGYSDAFVVPFRGNNRITLAEARSHKP